MIPELNYSRKLELDQKRMRRLNQQHIFNKFKLVVKYTKISLPHLSAKFN